MSVDNSKTKKGRSKGYETYLLHLAPAGADGTVNLCRHASPGCSEACLFTAGRGRFDKVRSARVNKTNYYTADPRGFKDQLAEEIHKVVWRHTKKMDTAPAIRLNATSDVNWVPFIRLIQKDLKDKCPIFYDYTKDLQRAIRVHQDDDLRYHITFSKSETNDMEVFEAVQKGVNVAVVFADVPDYWLDRPVIDGDKNDLRFLDPDGSIVALRAKGKAKKDKSGFVVRPFIPTKVKAAKKAASCININH